MIQNIFLWFANVGSAITDFAQASVRPISYATATEALSEAILGVVIITAGIIIARTSQRTPEHENVWTGRRLQFTGVFGTLLILLAFLRYEGIPYVSMQAVLGIVFLWALFTFAQLALYRQLVLKSARSQWRQRKTRDQYLPKPKVRSAR